MQEYILHNWREEGPLALLADCRRAPAPSHTTVKIRGPLALSHRVRAVPVPPGDTVVLDGSFDQLADDDELIIVELPEPLNIGQTFPVVASAEEHPGPSPPRHESDGSSGTVAVQANVDPGIISPERDAVFFVRYRERFVGVFETEVPIDAPTALRRVAEEFGAYNGPLDVTQLKLFRPTALASADSPELEPVVRGEFRWF